MFDGKYFDWNQKRIKAIVDYYGYKFFYGKKLADLGCGHADMSGVLYRLGSDITAVDARQDHLKIVTKKFPGIKTVKGNLDGPWPFHGQKFDMILDLGLMCHLASFENHLKAVCNTTHFLILETAVCDSDDPNKCVQVPEGKEVYDLSYNGMGCRPTAAAIERVLSECHMSFKRVDNSKFNAGDYVYDWQSRNDGSTSITKRRIWFCTKNLPGVVLPEAGGQPVVIYQPPNSSLVFSPQGVPTILGNNGSQPIHSYVVSGAPLPGATETQATVIYKPNTYTPPNPNDPNFSMMKHSQQFAIISPDHHHSNTLYPTPGIVLPTTMSSKNWIRKVSHLFPNLKVSSKAVTMQEFPKSSDGPNVIMCSIDTLQPHNRLWIDEWYGDQITNSHVEILQKCQAIVTPSIINAQEIRKYIPSANVIRADKAWPMVAVSNSERRHFLYFEKDEEATKMLIKNWNANWSKITVVGSRLKLPDFVDTIPDTASYTTIMSAFAGARALIDISNNLCYMSGLLNIAHQMSIPVISNNQACLSWGNSTLIVQDHTRYPTEDKIVAAINKYMNNGFKANPHFNLAHNDSVNTSLHKILGV